MDLKYLSFFGVETVRLWDCDSVKPEPRMSHKIQKISTADIKTGFIKKSNNNNLIYPQVNSTRETVPFNFFFLACRLLFVDSSGNDALPNQVTHYAIVKSVWHTIQSCVVMWRQRTFSRSNSLIKNYVFLLELVILNKTQKIIDVN